MASAGLDNAAEQLVQLLKDRSMQIAAAESCTAGLFAGIIGCIPGASACFWGSFVCYTAQAKMIMLGIKEELLSEYGMVSEQCARAMALGALEKSGVDLAVSITGLAGPGSDGSELELGTVWIATALRSAGSENIEAVKFHFSGERNNIREQAAGKALEQIIIRINRIVHL